MYERKMKNDLFFHVAVVVVVETAKRKKKCLEQEKRKKQWKIFGQMLVKMKLCTMSMSDIVSN